MRRNKLQRKPQRTLFCWLSWTLFIFCGWAGWAQSQDNPLLGEAPAWKAYKVQQGNQTSLKFQLKALKESKSSLKTKIYTQEDPTTSLQSAQVIDVGVRSSAKEKVSYLVSIWNAGVNTSLLRVFNPLGEKPLVFEKSYPGIEFLKWKFIEPNLIEVEYSTSEGVRVTDKLSIQGPSRASSKLSQ